MYTKCMNCRKWDQCPRCGACHTCRPDVRDACVAVRLADSAVSLQRGHSTRKRQASTFTQDSGLGANGCEPRVTGRDHNWYGSREMRDAAQIAADTPERVQRYIWRVSPNGDIVRITDAARMSPERRTAALLGLIAG